VRRGLLKIKPKVLDQENKKTREPIQRPGWYLPGIIAGIIMGVWLAGAYKNIPAGGFFGLAIYMLLLFWKESRESKKAGKIADQFDLFLVEVNGALAFGGPAMTVIRSVLDNAPEPLKGRVELMFQQYQQGLPVTPDKNKDINIFFELIKIKDAKGGTIDRSLVRLAEKIKKGRIQREESIAELKGSQMAIMSQYGILAMILLATYSQDIFKDIMIGTSGGRFVMVCVAMLVCLSLLFARKVVKDQ
jgi:Flp pilus assembly protein TadB